MEQRIMQVKEITTSGVMQQPKGYCPVLRLWLADVFEAQFWCPLSISVLGLN